MCHQPGKSSKLKVWFLLNARHFYTVVRSDYYNLETVLVVRISLSVFYLSNKDEMTIIK